MCAPALHAQGFGLNEIGACANATERRSSAGTVTGPGTSITIGTILTPTSLSISSGDFNGTGGTVTVNGDLALSGSGKTTI